MLLAGISAAYFMTLSVADLVSIATLNLFFIMGGNGTKDLNMASLTIQKALDIARNSEGDIDPAVSAYLEQQLADIWARIEAEPDSYILSKDEFAVLNFYRHRSMNPALAQSAVRRFWDNYSSPPRSEA
jgi:hypothetical protein